MGNKQSTEQSLSHTYTSIDAGHAKPEHIFIDPEKNTCIIINDRNQINIYYYSQTENKFINKTKYSTTAINIQSAIYDPCHSSLLYWDTLSYCQLNYTINDKLKIAHTEIIHELNLKMSVSDAHIIEASLFNEGNILLFVLNVCTIIAMKWNTSTHKHEFVTQYTLTNCDNIIGAGFHEKRTKMVALQKYKHHYYLNIYSIGQMLLCISSAEEEMKIQSMDKPHLLLSRLVYEPCPNYIEPHSRLVYEPPEWTKHILSQFKTVKNTIAILSHAQSALNRLITTQQKINGVTYVLSSHFGIKENNGKCKLIFSNHGDKILYQAGGGGSSYIHNTGRGHSYGEVSGWMNDFGPTHLIDCSTGNSLWSAGESSIDEGIGWTMNDYLVILMANDSVKSRCSLKLEGFESETMIAECLFNDVITTYDTLDGFVWDLCLLIAMFRGATDRWYREVSLCKYTMHKNKKIDISLEINSGSRSMPVCVGDNAKQFFAVTVSTEGKRSGIAKKFKTHFYESKPIAMEAFGDNDVLIKFQKNNGIICRNLTSPKDVYGPYFRAAQDKWAKK